MLNEKKYIRKSFWAHQYEKEEIFLRDMRKKGWKFVKLHKGIPTKYEFDKCEPEDIIYQLDYVISSEDTPSYHQLFEDSGWIEEYNWPAPNGKWYYFSKKSEGKDEKIYTSKDSRLELFNKVLKNFSLIFILSTLLELNGLRVMVPVLFEEKSLSIPVEIFTYTFILLMTLTIIFCLYNLIGLLRVKNKIKKS